MIPIWVIWNRKVPAKTTHVGVKEVKRKLQSKDAN